MIFSLGVFSAQVVREHFLNHDAQSTRVIVFSQFRFSVDEIMSTLRPHAPLVKPAEFIGQKSTASTDAGLAQSAHSTHYLQSNASKGLTQKMQQKVWLPCTGAVLCIVDLLWFIVSENTDTKWLRLALSFTL